MLLERLQLFVQVAEHLNLAQAARRLRVSASSVSQRLKMLEQEFGVKLYKRSRSGIELTDAGQTPLSGAGQIFQQLESLRKRLNPHSRAPVQTLRIGATANPTEKYLPSAIAKFHKLHPDIEVVFFTSRSRSLDKGLRSGEVEIALIQSPIDSTLADLACEHFAVDRLAFFVHPAHPLAHRPRVSVSDLARFPLIVRDSRQATEKMLSLLRSRGATLNVALSCASPRAVKASVRKKMGVGLLFRNVIEDEFKRKELKILKIKGAPEVLGTSYIVYHRTRTLRAPAREFLSILRALKPRQKPPPRLRKLTGTEASSRRR